eukprot:1183951-Prorocentrum_minimum.AAC.3
MTPAKVTASPFHLFHLCSPSAAEECVAHNQLSKRHRTPKVGVTHDTCQGDASPPLFFHPVAPRTLWRTNVALAPCPPRSLAFSHSSRRLRVCWYCDEEACNCVRSGGGKPCNGYHAEERSSCCARVAEVRKGIKQVSNPGDKKSADGNQQGGDLSGGVEAELLECAGLVAAQLRLPTVGGVLVQGALRHRAVNNLERGRNEGLSGLKLILIRGTSLHQAIDRRVHLLRAGEDLGLPGLVLHASLLGCADALQGVLFGVHGKTLGPGDGLACGSPEGGAAEGGGERQLSGRMLGSAGAERETLERRADGSHCGMKKCARR